MLTDLQKAAAQAIVNVFESGRPAGDYAALTVIPGDSGGLTYGRSQTTLASGGLYTLVAAYCADETAAHADALRPFLGQLEARDEALDHDEELKQALRAAGADPAMRASQDAFFDAHYWAPSQKSADALGVTTALGVAVIYDSHIHGSWQLIHDRTVKAHGDLSKLDERTWIACYIAERRAWFVGNANAVLHASVRRMDAFSDLIAAGNWDLVMPLAVRGQLVSAETIAGASQPPLLKRGSTDAETGGAVSALRAQLEQPPGDMFSTELEATVQSYQAAHGLEADGIVGAETWASLGRSRARLSWRRAQAQSRPHVVVPEGES